MKAIGERIFKLERNKAPAPKPAYDRVTAKDLGLQETWFRDAIFREPELVVAACRVAGRVPADEAWLPWRTEANFGSGPIDVLLVSSHGRIGIVETKLSYNPQKRREVVAQVLDYALSLQESDRDDLPELPASPDAPLEEDLQECLAAGRFLLVIAGDALDPRALRLSQSLLARHLTSEWDLAMVDLNVYRAASSEELFVVPELLGTVQSDLRQVVRVIVEGQSPRAKVVVDKIVNEVGAQGRQPRLASIDDFLAAVDANHADVARSLIQKLQALAESSQGKLAFSFQRASANLYWNSAAGPRRFVAVRADGRFRLILRYLQGAGLVEVALKVAEAASPTLKISPEDRATGTRYSRGNAEQLLALLDRIAASLTD